MTRHRGYAGLALASLLAGGMTFASLDVTATTSAPSWSNDRATAYQINLGHTGGQPDDSLTPPLIKVWSKSFNGQVSYPLIVNGKVYITVADSNQGAYGTSLYAFNQSDGSNAWTTDPVPLPTTYYWSNATYENGKIFAINEDGLMKAFDAVTGGLLWSSQMPGYLWSSPPTAFGGMVFTGGNGFVDAVSEADGTLLWRSSVANGDDSSPAVSSTGVYVSYACNQDYGFAPLTGASLWHHSTYCSGGGGQTPVLFGGSVYTRDFPTGNLILDASSGMQLGTYTASTMPAFAGSSMYVVNSGSLYSRDAATGTTQNWNFSVTGDNLTTAPVVVDGVVYVMGSSGNLYAVDATTGTQKTGSPIMVSAAAPMNGPTYGLGAGEGWLDVPVANQLFAFTSALDVAPGDLDFGNQPTGTSTAPAQITITNYGASATTLSGFATSGDFGQTNTCTSPLSQGQSCTASVTFTPTASGVRTGSLTFSDSVVGAHTVPLSGNVANGFPPAPPINLSAIPGLDQIRLTWSPGINGGSPITGYTIVQTPGGTTNVGSSTTSTTITGLSAGTTYSFQVTAANNNGTSSPAATSALVSLGAAGEIITQAGSIGTGGDTSVAQAPFALALNANHLYVGDLANPVVRDLDTNTFQEGVLAGNDGYGYSGDGKAATSAMIAGAGAIAYCGGATYFADTLNYVIRKIDGSGTISTIAGTGQAGHSGDGGPATSASFGRVLGLACRAAGGLYIADSDNGAIRILDGSGNISTWWSGLSFPTGLLEVSPGVVDASDAGSDNAVWQFTNTAYSLVAGNPGNQGYSGDGVPAAGAALWYPAGLAMSGANLLIADRKNDRVRMVSNGYISTFAGNGSAAVLNGPTGLALNATTLFVADVDGNLVSSVPLGNPVVSTIAGTGWPSRSGDGGQAANAQFGIPEAVAFDSLGNEYVADSQDAVIRKITTGGIVTTVVGTGTAGFNGDGWAALSTELNYPRGVAVNGQGDILIADTGNQRVRKVDHVTGNVSTIAGMGIAGYNGDGTPATVYQLNYPRNLAVDAAGDVLIADGGNNRIRKVTPAGAIITIAGTGTPGFLGDGGPATGADLYAPQGVALDVSGDVFVSDTLNNRVRRIDATTGTITTILGTGVAGPGADNVTANAAELNAPFGIAFDPAGNLYIADARNSRVRMLDTTGVVHTVVSGCGGFAAFSGDGGLASIAQTNFPFGVAVDSLGDLFIADEDNNRIRETPGLAGIRAASCQGQPSSAGSRTVNQSSGGTAGPRVFRTIITPATTSPATKPFVHHFTKLSVTKSSAPGRAPAKPAAAHHAVQPVTQPVPQRAGVFSEAPQRAKPGGLVARAQADVAAGSWVYGIPLVGLVALWLLLLLGRRRLFRKRRA